MQRDGNKSNRDLRIDLTELKCFDWYKQDRRINGQVIIAMVTISKGLTSSKEHLDATTKDSSKLYHFVLRNDLFQS